MKKNSHCQRQNCSLLNVLFSDIDYVDVVWRSFTIQWVNMAIFNPTRENISQTVSNTATVSMTRKLCYRKDDRAMLAI